MSVSLKEYCSKSKLANEIVRCGFCSNSLVHCGKYEIVQFGQEKEGLLCETCKKNGRALEMITRLNNHTKRSIYNKTI